jgi:hypothetical protein
VFVRSPLVVRHLTAAPAGHGARRCRAAEWPLHDVHIARSRGTASSPHSRGTLTWRLLQEPMHLHYERLILLLAWDGHISRNQLEVTCPLLLARLFSSAHALHL